MEDDYNRRLEEVQIERIVNTNSDNARRREESIEKVTSKSVNKSKSKRNGKKIKPVKGFVAGALVTVLIISGIKAYGEVKERVEFADDLSVATEIVVDNIQDRMFEEGLGTINDKGEFVIGDNEISDYYKLGIPADMAAIYAVDKAIDNAEENDKAVQSIYYDDVHCFTGGFYSGGNMKGIMGLPDYQSYLNEGKNALVEAYRNGTLDNILDSTDTKDVTK